MTDWLIAALFVGCVMGVAGCFTLVVMGSAYWVSDKWQAWRHPHNPKTCVFCVEADRQDKEQDW